MCVCMCVCVCVCVRTGVIRDYGYTFSNALAAHSLCLGAECALEPPLLSSKQLVNNVSLIRRGLTARTLNRRIAGGGVLYPYVSTPR